MHVDGVGGHKSFKMKSFFVAVGAFVFCGGGTESHIPKLYSTRDQFEFHERCFFIQVMIKHRQCRLMIVDGDPSLVNERTVAIAAEFGCNMVVSSPGTPQENRKLNAKIDKCPNLRGQ